MCGTRIHRGSNRYGSFPIMPMTGRIGEDETPYINEGFLYCLNCGETFNSDNVMFCNKCGSEIQVCPISRNKFRTGDRFAQCPICTTVFHYHHLTDWLNNDDRCPNCRETIDSIHKGIIGINYIIK